MLNYTTRRVPVELSDGTKMYVEAVAIGDADVGVTDWLKFELVTKVIRGLMTDISPVMKAVAPSKTSVKLGLELGIEGDTLIATLVGATGKANLEIAFEWGKSEK